MQRPTSLPLVIALAAAACSGSKETASPDSCSNVPASALVDAYVADPHYCVYTFATVASARQLVTAPNGDIFVAGAGQVAVLRDDNGDGVVDASEQRQF